ncbi:MAG TPA: HEAT repeat domain-containing protein [Bacteroidales bacterium]|nr:HEAT repeat domain-containing protein [Bacteroidales bacterium]
MKYIVFYILLLLVTDAIPAYCTPARPATTAGNTLDPGLREQLLKIIPDGFIPVNDPGYALQLGAFRLKSNADALLKKLTGHLKREAVIVKEDGYYKVRVPSYEDKPDTLERPPSASVLIRSDSLLTYSLLSRLCIKPDYFDSHFFTGVLDTIKKSAASAGKIFFLKGESPWLKRINYFGKSVSFVNVLIVAIVTSITIMFILLFIILLNRNRLEKEEKLQQFLLEKYQSMIIDYLYGNTTADEFRSIASDNYRRQVLIDQLIDVSVNLKGDASNKLLTLYKHLGLDRDSIARAYDHRWHKKIKGFRELAFMDIKDANAAIYKALNSSNEILRMEAQIALVRLSDDNPFEFLTHLTRPFSLWEQITLHELIIQHDLPIPSFRVWLHSTNPTVVMFALRMIREFKQEESEDSLKSVLLHPDPAVRKLAVQVAGDMKMHSTREVMRSMYKNQEYNICLEIIRSLGKMPDPSMIGFLKLVIDKEDDVQLQIEATKAMENIGEEGISALVKLMKSEYKNYNIIIRHVLDRRIY